MKKWLTTMGEWLKKQFEQKPINIIVPFIFPAPDDPRWTVTTDERHIIYSLDEIRCFMYDWTSGGFILVGELSLLDAEPHKPSLCAQKQYATAVDKAYRQTHPGSKPRLKNANRDYIIQILANINQRGPIPDSEET